MSDEHERLVAEFRALAETVLTRLEPILQQAAAPPARAGDAGDPDATGDQRPAFSGCSWCPVCALAALVRGEHHELLAFLAGQAAVLLALLREVLDEFLRGGPAPDRGPGGGGPAADDGRNDRTRSAAFVPITVTVKH